MTMNVDQAVISPDQADQVWDWRSEDINREMLEIVQSNNAAEHQAKLAHYRQELSNPASRVNMVFVMSRGPRFVDILVRS